MLRPVVLSGCNKFHVLSFGYCILMPDCKYQCVLLKISGEGLCGTGGFGLDAGRLDKLAEQFAQLVATGVRIGVVVGAGNFVRGCSLSERTGIRRVTGDQMGMLATVINALALRDTFEAHNIPVNVLGAFQVGSICQPFAQSLALAELGKGRVVIFAGGTGNPFFTTDTCAALRAAEIGADLLLKATKVDGVYSADPVEVPDAVLYRKLTYMDVLSRRLRVMDSTAISLCMENNLPIMVLKLKKEGNIQAALRGEQVGTLVQGD